MAKSKKGRNHIQGDGVKLFEMRWYKNKNVVIKHCPFRIFNRISCETIVIYCIILNSFFFSFCQTTHRHRRSAIFLNSTFVEVDCGSGQLGQPAALDYPDH